MNSKLTPTKCWQILCKDLRNYSISEDLNSTIFAILYKRTSLDINNDQYLLQIFGQTGQSKQCRPRSNAAMQHLIRVYTAIYLVGSRQKKIVKQKCWILCKVQPGIMVSQYLW